MGNWSCFRPRGVTAITAKLIHWDGELEEFSFPVRVSSLRAGNEDSEVLIVCDADEMGLEEFVSAVEDLVPGKLYFELPGSWVSRRLRAEVMGSLAVKASTALAASGGTGERFRCCFIGGAARKVEPLVMVDDDEEMIGRFGGGSTAVSAVVDGGGRRVVGNGVACKKGKFTPQMSMIIEE